MKKIVLAIVIGLTLTGFAQFKDSGLENPDIKE